MLLKHTIVEKISKIFEIRSHLINKSNKKIIVIIIIIIKTTTTPWSRDLSEKLRGPRLLKKFSACYEARKFITTFTTARHMSLS
jgi:hypothetical protein